jgi:hypothetical protein
LQQQRRDRGFAIETTQHKIRDKKMVRYCNYFISLFDLSSLLPFQQTVKPLEVEAIR